MNNFELLSLFSTALLFFIGVFTLDAGRVRPLEPHISPLASVNDVRLERRAIPAVSSILAVIINLVFIMVILYYGYGVRREELAYRNQTKLGEQVLCVLWWRGRQLLH